MFSDCDRCQYRKNQLVEVICQLRFPTILSISAREPVDFQEAIRQDFPKYKRLLEQPTPNLVGAPGSFKLEQVPQIVNYHFFSADGRWKVNLTNSFVALSTPAYTCWEDFAAKLDKVLAQFIPVYRPSYFERVGLRYVNAFSRKALGLEDSQFRELFQSAYLGLLAEEDTMERSFARAGQDVELTMSGNCRVKLHAGPGLLQRNNVKDEEIKFILDSDVFMLGKIEIALCAPALQTVHIQADRIFRGAITELLHEAMEPDAL